MRFLSALLATFTLFNPISAASLTQMLTSSYIVDLTSVDINTNTTMDMWRQYQQVQVDKNNVQTFIISKVGLLNPFNQTIQYEQAQLSGTGSSAMDGPIFDYAASSFVPSGSSRQWTSCSFSSLTQRPPDYCTEVLEVPAKNYTCGRDMMSTCILSEVACRHNGIIMPSVFYKLNIKTGEIMEQMDTKNSTQVWYWSNLNEKPTSGQFADNILLPARTSCPDQNDQFPAVFGTAPSMPTQAPPTAATQAPTSSSATTTPPTSTPTSQPTSRPTSSTGAGNPPGNVFTSSSTGGIGFNAAPSTSSISSIVLIIPALLSAFFRF